MSFPHLRHQRARGGVAASFAPGPGGARLSSLAQSAPLRLLLPDAEPDEWTTAALLNTGGGLAGGDEVTVSLALAPGARLTMATAAAEKVYRSLGPPTCVANAIQMGPGAALEWIPQEAILFDGARLERRTEAALAADSRLLALETLVLGRAAHGEVLGALCLRDAWRLRRGGALAWADTLRLDDAAPLDAALGFGRAGALATLLLAAPDAAALLPALRERLPAGAVRAGATCPAPGLLLARLLGEAGAVRAAVAALLPWARHALLDQPARLPRLWTN
ncbi:urease accessory protein UreD [Roseococcus sp. DSY-14]|uniref:urease accessory protein UreD n=1 Tax=Roseococcus sp. DSY-14 TaxID=3369650 RepID=UPI00387AE9B1